MRGRLAAAGLFAGTLLASSATALADTGAPTRARIRRRYEAARVLPLRSAEKSR